MWKTDMRAGSARFVPVGVNCDTHLLYVGFSVFVKVVYLGSIGKN